MHQNIFFYFLIWRKSSLRPFSFAQIFLAKLMRNFYNLFHALSIFRPDAIAIFWNCEAIFTFTSFFGSFWKRVFTARKEKIDPFLNLSDSSSTQISFFLHKFSSASQIFFRQMFQESFSGSKFQFFGENLTRIEPILESIAKLSESRLEHYRQFISVKILCTKPVILSETVKRLERALAGQRGNAFWIIATKSRRNRRRAVAERIVNLKEVFVAAIIMAKILWYF